VLRRAVCASIHSSGRQEIVFFALVVGGVAYWRESRDRGVRTCLPPVLQADSQSGGAAPTVSTVGFPDSRCVRVGTGCARPSATQASRSRSPDHCELGADLQKVRLRLARSGDERKHFMRKRLKGEKKS